MALNKSNMSEATINKLVAQSVVDALVEYEANRNSGNGNGNGNVNGSHNPGGSGGRTPHTARDCTYSKFLKCQPLNFKGAEGAPKTLQEAIELTRSLVDQKLLTYAARKAKKGDWITTQDTTMLNNRLTRGKMKVHYSGSLLGSYTVLAVCLIRFLKTLSHSDLGNKPLPISFLAVYRFLKILSHIDLGNKPLPISFLGSGLVFLLHSGLPLSFSSNLAVRLRSGLPFMANLSKDIQCAGSNIRPTMLDRTDFSSWKQCIRLYYRGKENGVNILKSIDEGPFQMGTFRETLAEGEEGAFHLGPKQPRVYSDLSPKDKERFVTALKLNRGLKESNYDQMYAYLKQHENRGQVNNKRGSGAVGNGGAHNRVGNVNSGQARQIKCYNCNGIGHIARNYTQPK
nr:integrase, catalytic region, zinc finger, CCHC-type, peptidase aspartic, catalytic [Tanacetum cinerariifolium]